eukprot:CAMPEP_0206027592 /NCGR_PEP_ID=MMETSP1464-20131121/43514_1 /ASSEMBLY_ACC=CAM_ASM_001124 /TAXON_ID=119497 /ORGANISM="Exanthemachrysis gayraliae, Strain RCC1523" /LENGTH=97 /DNA_ID=CAMNT_0053401635 /DNA_START=1 /DNA_END=294 /DNA_ORIENTATION=-
MSKPCRGRGRGEGGHLGGHNLEPAVRLARRRGAPPDIAGTIWACARRDPGSSTWSGQPGDPQAAALRCAVAESTRYTTASRVRDRRARARVLQTPRA